MILAAGHVKFREACKTHAFMRRVRSDVYLTRSPDGEKIYLASFDQIGYRRLNKMEHGWYTDDMCDGVMKGVVLFVGRHAEGDNYGDWKALGGIFMAGTQHSDWDGVTLYTRTFDNYAAAERFADSCAESEAEVCREEDEKYHLEQELNEGETDV